MEIIPITERKRVEPLFEGWQETLIWSCLEGVMGCVYAEDSERLETAAAMLGDFTFFAGKPSGEFLFSWQQVCSQDFMILVPQNKEWEELMKNVYGDRVKQIQRYAIKKEDGVWDLQKLQQAVESLNPEYSIQQIDEKLFVLATQTPWMRDLVSQFDDYAQYQSLGLGVMILKDGIPVSGASSYSRYTKGIEIEIDTRKDFRRKGLAYVCGASLILECVKRGLYPSWDAQNMWSVALAEKLGYHYGHPYTAFEFYR